MPQTKFVLTKALALGIRPIVLINKVDKPDGRPDWVLDETFDLFAALDADEEQPSSPCSTPPPRKAGPCRTRRRRAATWRRCST